MRTSLFVAIACVVGCGSKEADRAASGGGAAATACAAAIDKAIDGMIATRQKMIERGLAAGPLPPPDALAQMTAISNKLRTVMTVRCTADHWPEPVLACLAAASDQPSIKRCREQLPPDQAQRLQGEIVQVMSTGRPGPGPHAGLRAGAPGPNVGAMPGRVGAPAGATGADVPSGAAGAGSSATAAPQ